ncbi:hypothetical protein VTK73DRAFT_7774 [Phialemonium thermophilum]|uniref:Uncharacterized protein n=1 Tax=Phialemonium thermophilum TaxID=223376 RepID=A0ABR3XRH2_9PEZI
MYIPAHSRSTPDSPLPLRVNQWLQGHNTQPGYEVRTREQLRHWTLAPVAPPLSTVSPQSILARIQLLLTPEDDSSLGATRLARRNHRSPMQNTNITIGIVVGVLLGVFLIAVLVFCYLYSSSIRFRDRSKRRRRRSGGSSGSRSSKSSASSGSSAGPPAPAPPAPAS